MYVWVLLFNSGVRYDETKLLSNGQVGCGDKCGTSCCFESAEALLVNCLTHGFGFVKING